MNKEINRITEITNNQFAKEMGCYLCSCHHKYRRLLYTFTIVLMLTISYAIVAQQLPFASLNIADGLEDTVVFSIEQDDLGFLWISTRTGINRFDGARFWTYNRNHGLPHNLARDMLKTKDGTLWVASESGIAWFDGNKFQTLNGNTDDSRWPEKTSARAITQAPDGTLWVATYGAGVLQIKIGKTPKIIQRYDSNSGLKSDRIRSILADDSGNIWLGTSSQVIRIKNGNIKYIPIYDDNTEIRTFFQHSDGSIWAGTRHGVARYNGVSFKELSLGTDLSKQTINTITSDSKGNIWLGTRDFGVYRIGLDLKITHLDMTDGLPDNSVNTIFQDNEHNQWFGTYGGGIARLSTSKVLNWKAQGSLPNPNVYTIADDHKGCIWIGTNGNGVSSLCDGKMRHYTRDDGLPHNKIMSTMIDKQGDPWFGTLQGLSNFKEGKFINYDQAQGMSGSVVYHVMQARDGSLWIGTNNGLNHFVDGKYIQYSQSDGLPDNRINRILESQSGALWLASANGLTRYHDGEFTSWSTEDGLPANFINDFYEDKQGGLWIATNTGLSYFYEGQFKNWTTENGLPHNNCTVILAGNADDVWIGTSRGVAIFDGENFTVITSREGLVFDLVNRGAGYKDPLGNLWFGTGEGISRFASDFKPGASNFPPVHLLSVSNNSNPLSISDRAQINQQESSLHFKYSAISFQRAPDVYYRYRLISGKSSIWRETRLRELQINSLAAGNYVFEITARIGQGEWNKNHAKFRFTVIPPFWQTPWFIVLIIVTIILIFFYRNYRIQQHAIELENTVLMRTKQLEELNQGLEWLANHDGLTRLANRNQVHKKLEQLKPNSSELQLGIIVIDLDYFKVINDQHGHVIGDQVLLAFSTMLQSLMRDEQLAARWGGEEFLVLCPHINAMQLQSLTQQVLIHCRKLEIPIENRQLISLRCSAGFALTPKSSKKVEWEKTIQLADLALYDAKHGARNCAVGYIWKGDIPDDLNFVQAITDPLDALKAGLLTKATIK